jgi:hypothetical protein
MYDYITKLCRTQTEVNLNLVNPNVRGAGKEEARHRKYRRPERGCSQDHDRSAA